MKGDFARVTFDPARHYSQVFQQQGRVLLEADWNEQGQIHSHLLRALITDLFGPCWAAGTGFALTTSSTDANGSMTTLPVTDWQLAPGHFYVDGILCENDVVCTLATQPQAPTPDYGVADGKSGFENSPASFALWLDVWERHLSAVEAPAISDLALNGVDTASRAQVVWQLRMLDQGSAGQQLDLITAALNVQLKATADAANQAAISQQITDVGNLRNSITSTGNTDGDPCAEVGQVLTARTRWVLPHLSAQLGPVVADNDPCIIAADASYRGCENQLYRVEIHQGGLAAVAGAAIGASFKWSRENGSVVFPVLSNTLGASASDGSAQLTVAVANLGRDERLGLAVNDWVELVDDDYALGQRAFSLLQVGAIDIASDLVTLLVPKSITAYRLASGPGKHPLLRRWDQRDGAGAQGVLMLAEGAAITLEDGIQITFTPGAVYATGDYWLIPARVAGNGVLDWPTTGIAGTPAARPPLGLHHQAVLGVSGGDNGSYQECCCRFGPLCSLIGSQSNNQLVLNSTIGAPLAPASVVTKRATSKKPKRPKNP